MAHSNNSETLYKDSIEELAKTLSLVDIPIGYYLVTADGDFVSCSERVRQLLNIPKDGDIRQFNLSKFYKEPTYRETLIRELCGAEQAGQSYGRLVLPLTVSGKALFVQDHCRIIRHSRTNEVLGFLGCLVDVTEEETYRLLQEQLGTPIFRVDEKDLIVWANQDFCQLMEVSSEADLLGRPLASLFTHTTDYSLFRESIRSQAAIKNQIAWMSTLQRRDFIASITIGRVSPNEPFAAKVEDVTISQLHKHIIEQMPLGTFMYRIQGDKHYLQACNNAYKRMLGFEPAEDIRGWEIKQILADTTLLPEYLLELEQKGELEKTMVIRSVRDRQFVASVHVKLVKDRHERLRVGALVNIDNEFKLKKKMEELQFNIGQVLHTFSQTLLTAKLKSNLCVDALGPDPFGLGELPEAQVINTNLRLKCESLSKSLQRLVDAATTVQTSGNEQAGMDQIERYLRKLESLFQDVPQDLIPDTLSRIARSVSARCRIEFVGKIQRQLIREVEEHAQEINRLISIVSLRYLRDRTIEMDYEVSSLREYVTVGLEDVRTRIRISLSDLVNRAITHMTDFANNRRIELRKVGDWHQVAVKVDERDVVRAIGNVLHNAIKYSWTKGRIARSWIDISQVETDDFVSVVVENRGVPIPEQEIRDGLIYRVGFRGSLAHDRSRVGTGVGLADTWRVMRDHHGSVSVTSAPSNPAASATDYSRPFITTVTLKFVNDAGRMR